MPATATPAAPDLLAPAAAHDGAQRVVFRDIPARLAGGAAMAFAAIVVLQNIVRGSSAPAMDASAQEVLDYYATNRGTTTALVAGFVVCAAALAVFLGGTIRRMLAGDRPGWAITGLIGAVGVFTMFGITVAGEEGLAIVAADDRPDLGTVEALWTLHNSVFAVLLVSLSIALLGLARAGVAAGITPRAFEYVAPAGAVGLAVGAAAGPYLAAGEAMPLFGLSGLGFLCWLAFLATTGLRLFRAG